MNHWMKLEMEELVLSELKTMERGMRIESSGKNTRHLKYYT